MKKIIIASAIAAIAAPVFAQSAIDAYNLNPNELRGTARFMSMGGAFTSLGGDLSAVSQNPAGIGVYRRSEIGATLDIDIRNTSTQTNTTKVDDSHTKVYCNNFGYVGTIDLSGGMKSFSWGVNYNRLATFDNYYRGYNGSTSTSLSNYIASFTNESASTLDFGDNYNPYTDSDADWLSILSYNSYMINPKTANGSTYNGLFKNGTVGDAAYNVREKGYLDSYDISFGGNVSDVVYWGAGVGIVDMNYTRQVQYSESMDNAATEGSSNGGNAGFDLINAKSVSGTGANLKFGVIVRPTNELRVGISAQTPTWMRYNHGDYAQTYFNYNDGAISGSETTDYASYRSRINSPWRLNFGISGVIDNMFIISADYERIAYNDMKVKYQDTSDYWGGTSYIEDSYVTEDIKDYFKAANVVRVGAEVRVTPQFSIRAGYNVQLSNVRSETYDGYKEVFTAGTDPSYTLNKTTQNACFGLGYRYQQFYIDAAYVYRNRESKFCAYTNSDAGTAPTAKLTQDNHSIVFSAGLRF